MKPGARAEVQAIVLCGGRGERLRPYTDDRPKPMVEVGGRPIIAYLLGWLAQHGLTRVTLSCGYRWEVLRSYLGDGSERALTLNYAVEETPLGRGGGIRKAMESWPGGDAPALVINGDTLVGLDPWALLERHAASGAWATVVLSPLVSARGIVEYDEQEWVHSFREKPELPYWINAGLYVFSRKMIKSLPVKGDHEESTFPELASRQRLLAYPTRELWRTVDTIKDMSALTQEITAGLDLPYIETRPTGAR